MKYRNTETGVIIDVESVMGGVWEPVKDKAAEKTEEKPKKSEKGKAKK